MGTFYQSTKQASSTGGTSGNEYNFNLSVICNDDLISQSSTSYKVIATETSAYATYEAFESALDAFIEANICSAKAFRSINTYLGKINLSYYKQYFSNIKETELTETDSSSIIYYDGNTLMSDTSGYDRPPFYNFSNSSFLSINRIGAIFYSFNYISTVFLNIFSSATSSSSNIFRIGFVAFPETVIENNKLVISSLPSYTSACGAILEISLLNGNFTFTLSTRKGYAPKDISASSLSSAFSKLEDYSSGYNNNIASYVEFEEYTGQPTVTVELDPDPAVIQEFDNTQSFTLITTLNCDSETENGFYDDITYESDVLTVVDYKVNGEETRPQEGAGSIRFSVPAFSGVTAQTVSVTFRFKTDVEELTATSVESVITSKLEECEIVQEHTAWMIQCTGDKKDPYEEIWESQPGGGDGTLDWSSDEQPEFDYEGSSVPVLGDGYSEMGIISIYRADQMPDITDSTLTTPRTYSGVGGFTALLSKFLWGTNWTDNILANNKVKITNWSISDGILGYFILPYEVPTVKPSDFPALSEYPYQDGYSVQIAKIPYQVGTGSDPNDLRSPIVIQQFTSVDMGSIKLDEFYGSYLDYDPYTTIRLYLPFIGFQTLSANEVMGKIIAVKYVFDNLTGSFVAHVSIDGITYYTYNGNAAYRIPLTGATYSNLVSGLGSTVSGVLSMAAGVAGMATGNVAMGAIGVAGGLSSAMQGANAGNSREIKTIQNLSLNSGFLAPRNCFLMISSPRLSQAKNKLQIIGGKTNRTLSVSNLSGYTEFTKIHVDTISGATDEEKTAIENICMSGVIL